MTYTDPSGLEQAPYGPKPKITQNEIKAPDYPSGPCHMMTLQGIAEDYSGENMTFEQIENAATELNDAIASNGLPVVDIANGYYVGDDEAVVHNAMKALGVDDVYVHIYRQGDQGYSTASEEADYTIRITPSGHFQLGDSEGKLLSDRYRYNNPDNMNSSDDVELRYVVIRQIPRGIKEE